MTTLSTNPENVKKENKWVKIVKNFNFNKKICAKNVKKAISWMSRTFVIKTLEEFNHVNYIHLLMNANNAISNFILKMESV